MMGFAFRASAFREEGVCSVYPQKPMNTPPRTLAASFGMLLLLALPAQAQIQVAMKLDKTIHIVQEPIRVNLTITNRSGSDFIIGGPSGRKWIDFEITDAGGQRLSSNHTDDTQATVFAAGSTITKKFAVAGQHVLEQGHYGVKALVYHGPSAQHYESNRARVQVIEGQRFGKPLQFGVPSGFPDAGRLRSYVMLTHQDMDRSYMYLRLVDERSGGFITTFQLGTLTLFREPQYTLDRGNNLHIIFLTAPTLYRYTVIRPDGTVAAQTMHQETEVDRPKLYLNASNEVLMKGGLVYDPAAIRREQERQSTGKSIGARPPGL